MGVLSLRRPSDDDLARVVDEQKRAAVTYAPVGGTVSGDTPSGFRFETFERRIGPASAFARARSALANWQPQRGSGIAVRADGEIAVGTTVALAAPLPIGFALAACRIVAVVDQEDRYGFAYGTLPAHPESGEELFILERRADDLIFRIAVFSRPHQLLTRIGSPIARLIQRRATEKYLTAMEDIDRDSR